jgi:hypothetical protein
MWPPNSFGLVDRCALFDIRNQDRRELSGLAHCVPPAVGRLAQMPVPVCLFRRKDRSCAHSFRTEHQAERSPSGRIDPFAEPSGNGRSLRTPAIQSGTKRLILTTRSSAAGLLAAIRVQAACVESGPTFLAEFDQMIDALRRRQLH